MHAVTAIVTGGGYNQHATLLAQVNRPGKKRIGVNARNPFASADVDDVSAFVHAAFDCPREVKLRQVAAVVAEDWCHQTTATWCQAKRAAEGLPEDDACHVCAVSRHSTGTGLVTHQSIDTAHLGAAETGVAEINWSVEDGDTHAGGRPVLGRGAPAAHSE